MAPFCITCACPRLPKLSNQGRLRKQCTITRDLDATVVFRFCGGARSRRSFHGWEPEKVRSVRSLFSDLPSRRTPGRGECAGQGVRGGVGGSWQKLMFCLAGLAGLRRLSPGLMSLLAPHFLRPPLLRGVGLDWHLGLRASCRFLTETCQPGAISGQLCGSSRPSSPIVQWG